MSDNLSEAAAWRKLAEWCAITEAYYLCWSILDWSLRTPNGRGQKAPFRARWKAMSNRASAHAATGDLCTRDSGPMGLGYTAPNHNGRVIFCLLMAIECETEARDAE